MKKMRVLVANDPCTYREVIADAFQELRPHIEVSVAEPDGLVVEVERLHPHLVVCSCPCGASQNGTLSWVILYPNGENYAEIITTKECATVADVNFEDILSVVDRTELLWRAA